MKSSTFSLFAQVLGLVDRRKFDALASEHAVEKSSKGFGSWLQFVAMLFAQLSDAASLREVSLGLASASGKLRHLGVDSAPSRSTLAYANAHRHWEFFRDVFAALYATTASEAKRLKRRFQFKNPLYALDSTTIPLCLGMFDWARYRRSKGAVKLYLLLDRQGCLPRWAKVTDGKRADVKVAWTLDPRPGSVVAMDRGHNDYALFAKWHKQRVYFVTRMKDDAQYEVVEERPVPGWANAESDETIVLTGLGARRACPHELRRVVVWDEKSGRELAFLTNNFDLAAATIGRIYRERWQIEQFFKALKQEPAGEDVPGDDGERGADAALDGIDSHVADEAAANALPARVVPVAPYSGVTRLHVRAQGLAKMAGRPDGAEAAEAALRLWFVFWLAIWTAGVVAAGKREKIGWFQKRGQVLGKAITGQ